LRPARAQRGRFAAPAGLHDVRAAPHRPRAPPRAALAARPRGAHHAADRPRHGRGHAGRPAARPEHAPRVFVAAPTPGGPGGAPFAPQPHPAAAILAGDFNLLPGSSCHARLLAPDALCVPLWLDAWESARPGEPHAPTVGLHGTFDYPYASAALASRVRAVRVDTTPTGSDHQPLLLEYV
jgi:endonuclease/exonuclease/phosphatase family metal-dependent hydrolase